MPRALTLNPPLPQLHDASAEGFAAVNRAALGVLANVCIAEGVEPPAECETGDPCRVRREVYFALERLGYLSRRKADSAKNDREVLSALRSVLHIEATDLAVIFLLRSLMQTNLNAAQTEAENACKWGRVAVLSPL